MESRHIQSKNFRKTSITIILILWFYPVIREILKHIIKAGKGIEINTSSFRYKLNDLTPLRKILKLYNELGGEIITIGSDAHKAEDIGHKFDYIKK